MNPRTPLSIALLLTLTSSIATAALADGTTTSRTSLSAAQEVQPDPVVSGGEARASVRFDAELSELRVRVRFAGLEGNVTRLHLHCNVAGANGPIAIGLIDFVNGDFDNSDVVTFSGNRISGTLTNDEFPDVDGCPDVVGRPVNNVASLAAAIDAGLIYWNLHTDAFPAGELRGQVRPLTELADRRDDAKDDD